MTSGPREPSSRLAAGYTSLDSWITWPWARRTSDGGWVTPLFLNSPSSSVPLASRGGQARSGATGVTVRIPSSAARQALRAAQRGVRAALRLAGGLADEARVAEDVD